MTRLMLSLAAILGLLTSPCVAGAHDLAGMIHQGLKDPLVTQATAAAQAASMSASHGLTSAPEQYRIKSVFLTAQAWGPLPHALSICFLGGSPQLRMRIVNVMTTQWKVGSLTHRQLTYDSSFSTAPLCMSQATKTDIKVGFLSDEKHYGYWSFVGQESTQHYPSMNFSGFDTPEAPTGSEFVRLVTHEMGHALGLEHEHQSPSVQHCEWNYSLIFADYKWAPYDDMTAWDVMLSNFEQLKNTMNGSVPTYQVSAYDKLSVMHYHFEAKYFTDGASDNCYIPKENVNPSSQDLVAITRAYPAMQPSREAQVDILKEALESRFIQGRDELRAVLEAKLRKLLSASPSP